MSCQSRRLLLSSALAMILAISSAFVQSNNLRSPVTAFVPTTDKRYSRQAGGAAALQRQQPLLLQMQLDPTDVVQAATTLAQGLQQSSDATASLPSAVETAFTWMASTVAIDVDVTNLHLAHEHTQPLWGASDPYLSAGGSIAPTNKALLDLGPPAPPIESLTPEWIQKALSLGYQVREAETSMTPESILPGFQPTRGILGLHSPNVPAETPETFAAQVEWSARFLPVVDKLPLAAFYYALVEFFILRPGLDVYKEETEEDFVGLTIETMAVTGVRVGVFSLIAIVTWGIFG